MIEIASRERLIYIMQLVYMCTVDLYDGIFKYFTKEPDWKQLFSCQELEN